MYSQPQMASESKKSDKDYDFGDMDGMYSQPQMASESKKSDKDYDFGDMDGMYSQAQMASSSKKSKKYTDDMDGMYSQAQMALEGGGKKKMLNKKKSVRKMKGGAVPSVPADEIKMIQAKVDRIESKLKGSKLPDKVSLLKKLEILKQFLASQN